MKVPRWLARIPRWFGVVSACLGCAGTAWTFNSLAPPELRLWNRDEGAGRPPCERIGDAGLPCSGDGLMVALQTNNRPMIDLFVAAGVGPATLVAGGRGNPEPVWERAVAQKLPGFGYLLGRKAWPAISPYECPYNDERSGELNYQCGVTLTILREGYEGPEICQLMRLDPARTKMLPTLRADLERARASDDETWSEYTAPGSCGPAPPKEVRAGQMTECAFSGDRDGCMTRYCEQGRKAFLAEYPTSESYQRASAPTEISSYAKHLARCYPAEAAQLLAFP